jgi:hypothetical protein
MEATYMGKPVSSMSKEELIEALKNVSYLYKSTLEQHSKDLDLLVH